MLFDIYHSVYIAISLVITVGALILFRKMFTPPHGDTEANTCARVHGKADCLVLKISGILTVVIHISSIWVEFLITGSAVAYPNILFPIFFCNLSMYLLLICGCIRNKTGKAYTWLATFTAYAGTIGALISLFYPDFYLAQPDFWDWGIFKSFLSHSTMMFGCLWLFTAGYVKIRVSNLLPYIAGLGGTWIVGMAINGLFALCHLDPPNAMFLQQSAIEGVPFLNGYGIALLMLALIFVFTAIWEFFACPKGTRWYDLLAKKFGKKQKDGAE